MTFAPIKDKPRRDQAAAAARPIDHLLNRATALRANDQRVLRLTFAQVSGGLERRDDPSLA
jgi:hypothetical protein